MNQVLPPLLLGLLVVFTARRWVSLPLAAFLAAAWFTALGLGTGGRLGVDAMCTLAVCALWVEVGEISLATGETRPSSERDLAFAGFVGGGLGGVGLVGALGWTAAVPGLAALGALAARLASGADLEASARGAAELPVHGDRARVVQGVLAVAALLSIWRPA